MKRTRMIAMACAIAMLGACAGPNTGISTLQFSGETVPFPDDYQAAAIRVLRSNPGFANNPNLSISTPLPTLGVTATSPRRWYACIRGITPPGPPPTRLKPLLEMAGNALDPASVAGSYDAVLFFRGSGLPTVRLAYDAPLCRVASFAPLTLPPTP